jgi:hypothetical protein
MRTYMTSAACSAVMVLATACTSLMPDRRPLSIPPDAMKSPFGIEYVLVTLKRGDEDFHNRGTAKTYKDIGAKWVKFEECSWQMCEPQPPVNGRHSYTWEKLDSHIRWWQASGFQIQLHVKPRSEWAGQPAQRSKRYLSDNDEFLKRFSIFISTPPKEEYWDDWGEFVSVLVERYDGDGLDDMPGLKYPIMYYELESEVQHILYWMGSLEDYGRALRIFHREAKQVYPDVKVILSGIELGAIARDNPSDIEMERRQAALTAADPDPDRSGYLNEIGQFIEGTLAMGDYYDIVEFHALKDYTVIPGTAAYLRRKLADLGYTKEIWAGDATSAPEIGTLAALSGSEVYEGPSGRINRILKDPTHPEYSSVNKWYRREQAALTIKKYVISIESDLKRVFMCSLEDWPWSPLPHHGLADSDGTPRPVFRAIQFLTRKLAEFDEQSRLELGEDVYAFRFDSQGDLFFVLWYETNEEELDLPVENEPTTKVSIPIESGSARVYPFDLVCSEPEAEGKKVSATNGRLILELNRMPVFVQAAAIKE